MSDKEDKYNDAIERYYILKNKYDRYIANTKKNIFTPIGEDGKSVKKQLSIEDKKKLLMKQQYKCINCKKLGGTIFDNRNNKLKAICGNKDTPCKLNIEIDKGKLSYVPSNLNKLDDEIKDCKKKITLLKLDYLFNYIN